jgi:4-hydroxyproline epimerase
MRTIRVVDSHTGGEPTRVVVSGGPELGSGTCAEKRRIFETQFDHYRRAIVNEPRGSDVLVGAMLVEPHDPSCATGVIFFDNVTYLGMCGHGSIGLVVTLAHLGRITPGLHRIETPVGIVTAVLHEDGAVSITNIPAYRRTKDAVVTLANGSRLVGDVAWGGNWFFLLEDHGQMVSVQHVDALTDFAWQLRQAINAQGFPEVDHVVLLADAGSASERRHSRNFVLCPGKAYDRSPCGTGTSARMACLAADNKLAEAESYVQESIIGSRFIGHYFWEDRQRNRILPTIRGTAFVTAEGNQILDEHDPFCWGLLTNSK